MFIHRKQTRSLELVLAVAGLGAMVTLACSAIHSVLADENSVRLAELTQSVDAHQHKVLAKLAQQARNRASTHRPVQVAAR